MKSNLVTILIIILLFGIIISEFPRNKTVSSSAYTKCDSIISIKISNHKEDGDMRIFEITDRTEIDRYCKLLSEKSLTGMINMRAVRDMYVFTIVTMNNERYIETIVKYTIFDGVVIEDQQRSPYRQDGFHWFLMDNAPDSLRPE